MLRTRTALCAAAALFASHAAAQDVLLIPDSDTDRVWMFSAADGSLIDDAFITDPGTDGGTDVFNRPIEVLVGVRGELFVTDQFADVVSVFRPDGTYEGIFSNEGVRDTSVMDNIRGGHVPSQGPYAFDVLVANSGATNDLVVSQKNVKAFETLSGTELGDFAFNRYGGIRGPFDVVEFNGEILVADEGQDKIVRYTFDGTFNERFTSSFDVPQLDFPQQMSVTGSNTLLVASFSAGFILEFNAAGDLIGQYDPGTLELYRGVHELDNGNLLVTTTTGVFEVTRAGIVVDTEATGSGFRYITRIPAPAAAARRVPAAQDLEVPAPDQRPRDEIFADELGIDHQRNETQQEAGS